MSGLTGKLWPSHPKPQQDELLSSWLSRVALSNAPRAHTFCHLVWPNKQIWTRDIDLCGDEALITSLSQHTATSLDKARSTKLEVFEGIVFEKLIQNGRTRWIMPTGVFHRERTRFGLQWCPLCFQSDDVSYFRKHWRFAFVSCCPRHGVILADRCHNCGSPVLPFNRGPNICHLCGIDLRDYPVVIGESVALQFEYCLIKRAYDGHTCLAPYEPIYPIAYFDIIRRLVQLIAFSNHAQQLREIIARRYGGDPSPPVYDPDRHDIEFIPPKDRHKLMGLVARILPGWPFRLIGVCSEAEVWSSQILKDMKPVRYHLWEPTKQYLSGIALPRRTGNKNI
ncbi:MAG: TniQ family protein [Magnetovibrio sp.]|nr:TniQ family protein [Magnetovibrio sp.]